MSGMRLLFAAMGAGSLGTANLTGQTLSSSTTAPTTATCSVLLQVDGQIIYQSGSPPPVPAGEWNSEEPFPDVGNGWEVRFSQVSGATPNFGVAVNVWHRLSSDQTCGYSVTGGSISGVMRVEIRPVGGSIQAVADFNMTAESL